MKDEPFEGRIIEFAKNKNCQNENDVDEELFNSQPVTIDQD